MRTLAEYACASGSIVPSAMLARRMREGREGHVLLQNQLPEGWQCEAALSLECTVSGVNLRVQGRADALLAGNDSVQIIEIKTTAGNPYEICQQDYPAHWAQAEIYAHIYCAQNNCHEAELQLIYAGTRGGRQVFKRRFSSDELVQRFLQYATPYALFLSGEERFRDAAAPTLRELRFPYPVYRDGQRDMAKCVFRALTQGSRALIEAPTGIGKTAASLYGALRALGTGKLSAIFYLTARTTGRRAAEDALSRMRSRGLKLRSVTITAKEKICFMGKVDCMPCPYANGYYDRRREALREASQLEVFTAETIAELAREHEICPFELSLDLSELADVVICDYNYVFDPRVRLKRHFDRKSRAGLLIDEAHNLPDRMREMYSAELSGERVMQLKMRIAETFGEQDPLSSAIATLEAALTEPDAEFDARREAPAAIVKAASDFAEQAEQLRVSDEDTLELAMECAWYARIAKQFDDDVYRAMIRPEGAHQHIISRLWCFAPEKYLDRAFDRVQGAALFSATLAPIDFYASRLAVPDKARRLVLLSPFPEENLFVARIPISVRYRDRSNTMETVVQVLHAMIHARAGNYLACFPSHAYLMQAQRYYRTRFPEDHVIVQEARMHEGERMRFIEAFKPSLEQSMLAFIVLGGVFAEGVDLPGELLSGAAIISTGIPQVNAESELLREIYDDGFEGGTDAAYTYPGFRRVLQAAGRVIRTEEDRGVVLLLDERYASEKYQELMPQHWQVRRIKRMSELKAQLNLFWGQQSD